MTLFPFVFLKYRYLKADKVLVNHEKIHLKQQLELLILPFYLLYVLEFLLRLIQYRNWKIAYQNISFEREAYRHQEDFSYLSKRPFWAFLGYA